MQRLSYPTETVLSNKITRNRTVLSFKDSPRKPLGRRPLLRPRSWRTEIKICTFLLLRLVEGRKGGGGGANWGGGPRGGACAKSPLSLFLSSFPSSFLPFSNLVFAKTFSSPQSAPSWENNRIAQSNRGRKRDFPRGMKMESGKAWRLTADIGYVDFVAGNYHAAQ